MSFTQSSVLSPLSFGRAGREVEADGEAARFEVVERGGAAEDAEQAVRDDEAEFVHVGAALVRRVDVHRLEEVRGVCQSLALVARFR